MAAVAVDFYDCGIRIAECGIRIETTTTNNYFFASITAPMAEADGVDRLLGEGLAVGGDEVRIDGFNRLGAAYQNYGYRAAAGGSQHYRVSGRDTGSSHWLIHVAQRAQFPTGPSGARTAP